MHLTELFYSIAECTGMAIENKKDARDYFLNLYEISSMSLQGTSVSQETIFEIAFLGTMVELAKTHPIDPGFPLQGLDFGSVSQAKALKRVASTLNLPHLRPNLYMIISYPGIVLGTKMISSLRGSKESSLTPFEPSLLQA